MNSQPVSMGLGPGIGKTTNVVTWVLTGLSVVAVALRLIARRLKKDYGLDDATIVLSICFLLSFNALISKSIGEGIGAHVQTLSKHQGMEATKWVAIANTLAVHCFSWPKLAVVFLLKRLLLPGRLTLVGLFGSVIFLICCAIVLDYMLIGICTPPARQWDKSVPGTCWSPSILTNFAIFTGALSASLDLTYALYPIYTIWNLQMSVRRRLAYCSIMSLGLIAFAFTVYKCTKLPALDDPPDPTYLSAQLLLWTSIESNVVTLAACIPTLSPLVRLIKEKTIKSFSKYSSSRVPSVNPLKHPNQSRRSKHFKLDGSELARYPHSYNGESIGDGPHTRHSSIGQLGRTSARKHDLESGPPSPDNIELLNNPASARIQAWAGKPESSQGSANGTEEQDAHSWNRNGIARNVEVSVTESRRATPERRF